MNDMSKAEENFKLIDEHIARKEYYKKVNSQGWNISVGLTYWDDIIKLCENDGTYEDDWNEGDCN